MASKTIIKTASKASKAGSDGKKGANGAGTTVVVTKATVTRGSPSSENVYDDAVKEIVALSENDAYSKKVDNGPLAEARGKDTWRLHAQLRATDQVNKNLERSVSTIRGSLADLDQHRQTDTQGMTSLVTRYGDELTQKLASNKNTIQGWFGSTTESLAATVAACQKSVTDSVSRCQGALNKNVNESTADLQGRLDGLTKTVKDSFQKLAAATAGSEENIRSQTDSFSKAVEGILGNLQGDMEKRIGEFRDESTRLIDKRLNQVDVSFAAVRADQEVIKALLTDIIKDRMGRAEPRVR